MKLGNLEEEELIIVYGRTMSKLYDEEVAHRLRQRDYENVKVLAGGLRAWESLRYQVE
jgi:3-mercaptopyruvate sulfurtransferase SseA